MLGRNKRLIFIIIIIILTAGVVLSGCQNAAKIISPAAVQQGSVTMVLRGATATTTVTASPTYTHTPPAPPTLIVQEPPATRPATPCSDDLALVMELNNAAGPQGELPVQASGSQINKGWRVRNTGTCTWDSAYALTLTDKAPEWMLTSQPVAVGGSVKPGQLYDFWVQLQLPLMPGAYQVEWALKNGRGTSIGDPLSFSFEVAVFQTGTPTPEVYLLASPLEVLRGEEAFIAWSASQAKAAYFYHYGQAWQEHPVEVNGSTVVEPERTTTYELRVVKGDDTVETHRITIEVLPFDPPKIMVFRFEPGDIIDFGQCVDILWRVIGRVNTVTVLRNGAIYITSLHESGNTWDCPSEIGIYRYTLQVVGPGGAIEAERTLEVR